MTDLDFRAVYASSDAFNIREFKPSFASLVIHTDLPQAILVGDANLNQLLGRYVKFITQRSISLVENVEEADGAIIAIEAGKAVVLLHNKYWQPTPTQAFLDLPTIILNG